MSSNLSPTVRQAGNLLGNPLAVEDATYRQMIIDWGRQQIEEEYPEDPLRAPLNLIRRQWALMEWDRVIRTNGRELRGLVAGAAVRELEFQLQRREEAIRAEDAEQRRRDAAVFDADLNLRQTTVLADRELDRQKDFTTHQHVLTESAADAASRRRMIELVNETELAIRRLLNEALIRAMGTSTADELIAATQKINAEIRRIRHDAQLTPDEQHVQIKALLDILPSMLQAMRANRG